MVGGLLRNAIGMDRLRAAVAQATGGLPRDNGRLAMLDNSYSYLRQFTPDVLKAISFTGGTGLPSAWTHRRARALNALADRQRL